MGSIFARKFANRTTYRVQIRRRGYEEWRCTFDSYQDAKEFLDIHEPIYILEKRSKAYLDYQKAKFKKDRGYDKNMDRQHVVVLNSMRYKIK